MILRMTNSGVSESMVNLEFEIKPDQAISPIVHEPDAYKALGELFKSTPIDRASMSSYAVIAGMAKISWKQPFNTFEEFDAIYRSKHPGPDTESRIKDIDKYSNVPPNDFPPIVLFTNGDGLLQADGARRIMAHLLQGESSIYALVVIPRRKVHKILEPSFKQQIKDLHHSKKWFDAYQEIIELGLKGKRPYNGRFPKTLDFSVLHGKIVAEFGCNNGMAMLEAAYCGAARVVGFDYIQQNVEIINVMAKRLGLPVEGYHADFNDPKFPAMVNEIVPEYDYGVYLSVYRTRELQDCDETLKLIWQRCKEGMFFEGHCDRSIDTDDFYQNVFKKLGDCSVVKLPKGIIEAPYDGWYRPKYLLRKRQ